MKLVSMDENAVLDPTQILKENTTLQRKPRLTARDFQKLHVDSEKGDEQWWSTFALVPPLQNNAL